MVMKRPQFHVWPELARSPRKVRAFRGPPIALKVIFAVPVAILSLGIAGYIALVDVWGLMGSDVPGRAISVSKIDHLRHGPSFRASYKWELDGLTLRGETTIKPEEFDALIAAGVRDRSRSRSQSPFFPSSTTAPLALRTLRIGPWRMTDAASWFPSDRPSIAFMILLPLLLASPMLVGVGCSGRETWRTWQLYRWGRATRGVIARKRDDRATRFWIDYAITTPDGHQHKATQRVDMLLFQQIREGEEVTVLHPEGKSKPSVVYEYGGYRCD